MGKYDFGNYICALREEKGLTQSGLGELLGVTNKAVSRWENGSAYPSTELMLPLANALGVPVENLYRMISDGRLAEDSTPLEETEGSVTSSEEASVEQPPKRKKRTLMWVLIAVAAFLTLSLVAVSSILLLRSAKTPAERTAEAILPFLSVLSEMEDGGVVQVEGDLGRDFFPSVEQEKVDVSLSYEFKKGKERVGLHFGNRETQADVTVNGDGNRYVITSQRLLGEENLSFEREGLMEKLETSIFSPYGNSKYAMTEEEYELIRTLVEGYDQGESEELERLLAEASERIEEQMKDKTDVKTKRETVSLLDGETGAWVTTVVMDEAYLLALLDAVQTEWKQNQALREAMTEYFSDMDLSALMIEEQDIGKLVDEALAAWKESIPKSHPSITIRTAKKGGYLVLFELDMTSTDNSTPNQPMTVTWDASFVMTRSPKKAPDFEVNFQGLVNGKTEFEVKGSYTTSDAGKHSVLFLVNQTGEMNSSTRVNCDLLLGENGWMELDAAVKLAAGYETIDKANYQPLMELSVEGNYETTKKAIAVGITSAKLKVGEKVWEISDSTFRITLSAADPAKITIPETATDIPSMTEEKADGLTETVNQSINQFATQLNASLGANFLRQEYQMDRVTLRVENQGSVGYDEKNRLLFWLEFAGPNEKTGTLHVYQTNTLAPVKSIPIAEEYARNSKILVNNGKVLLYVSWKKAAFLYDAATMTLEKTVTLPYEPSGLVMDGNTLILHHRDQNTVYRVDMTTNETKKLATFSHPIEKLVLSPKDHTVMVYGSEWRGSHYTGNVCISIYSTETGRCLVNQYNPPKKTDVVLFNGKAFVIGDITFSPSTGQVLSTHDPERPNIWVDDSVYMTYNIYTNVLDVYQNGPVHKGKVGSVNALTQQAVVYRISDGRYLVVNSSNSGRFERFATSLHIHRVWKIG